MIKTKADLNEYLKADFIANGSPKFHIFSRYTFNESYGIIKYLRLFRKTEYYANNKNGVFRKLRYYVFLFKLKSYSNKTGVWIPLNSVGHSLTIGHLGSIVLHGDVKAGNYLFLLPGVLIGQTQPGMVPELGDHVYLGPGAKAFGKIKIGNHVIVGPNSVVVKDVEDGCIVSGVPAVVIKRTL